jgi:hypothetical protein
LGDALRRKAPLRDGFDATGNDDVMTASDQAFGVCCLRAERQAAKGARPVTVRGIEA